MPRTLITEQTGAATSSPFTVGKGINKESTDNILDGLVTLIATNLSGADTVDLQVSHDGGSNFNDLYEDGTQIQLTTTITAIVVRGPGIFRVNKGTTSGSVGCYASTPSRP